MKETVAARLGQLRERYGFTQEQLAEKISVSRQAVSKWECGDAVPDLDNLSALATLYNITLDELVGRSEATPKSNVHISFKEGINVQDKDKHVHVGWDGVRIDKEGIWIDEAACESQEKRYEHHMHWHKRSAFSRIPIIPLLFVVFLVLGLFFGKWMLGLGVLAWSFTWGSITGIVDAIYFKRGSRKICDYVAGLFFSLGLSSFLFVGFVYDQWSSGPVLPFPSWYLPLGGLVVCMLIHMLWPKPERK